MMFYGKANATIPKRYKLQFKHLKVANNVKNSEENLLICPETDLYLFNSYKKIKKFAMFLSLDFYNSRLLANRINANVKNSFLRKVIYFILSKSKYKDIFLSNDIYYSYNCEYIKLFLEKNNIRAERMIYLCGYLSAEHFNVATNRNKDNIILYNPKKGFDFTKKVITRFKELHCEYNFIPLTNLTAAEVSNLMEKSKLYIDFGNFPGPERIPREAVIANCNIITSKSGSANNNIDVPIPDDFKFDINKPNVIDEIINLMYKMLVNYDAYVPYFDNYRKKVYSQKKVFIDNVKKFFFE